MKKFKVIVAGSRNFFEYEFLCLKLDYLLSLKKKTHKIIIVSGESRGADKLGELYARERGYVIERYPADWSKGRGAGYIRNREMAKVGNACVCFIVNNSKGATDMYNTAKKHGLNTKAFYFEIYERD